MSRLNLFVRSDNEQTPGQTTTAAPLDWLKYVVAFCIVMALLSANWQAVRAWFGSPAQTSAQSGLVPAAAAAPPIEIKVNSAREAATIANAQGAAYAPAAGKVYLVCNVTATLLPASTPGGSWRVGGGNVVMTGSDNQLYRNLTLLSPAGLQELNAQLAPGATATGDIIFEVAPGVRPATLQYTLPVT